MEGGEAWTYIPFRKLEGNKGHKKAGSIYKERHVRKSPAGVEKKGQNRSERTTKKGEREGKKERSRARGK